MILGNRKCKGRVDGRMKGSRAIMFILEGQTEENYFSVRCFQMEEAYAEQKYLEGCFVADRNRTYGLLRPFK